jgi:putative (di)nucleoside polyphosphate hydrolase
MLEFNKRPYRLCAGICLVNQENKVFVGQRIDSASDAWQMPQGGIDKGELPFDAAQRELLEEIGTNKATLIAELSQPLDYDLPHDLADKIWQGKFRGQKQYWFLMRFTGHDSDISLDTQHPEFSAYQWIDMHLLPSLAIDFKKTVYETIVAEFTKYLK